MAKKKKTVAPFFQGPGSYELNEPSKFINERGHEFFGEGEGKRIADIGVWSGRQIDFCHGLVGDSGQIHGIDIPHPMVKQRLIEAEAKARSKGIVGFFHEMELTKLLFRSNYFDFAICWRVLHNITDGTLMEVLGEIHRVLKPEGKALVAVRAVKDYMPKYPVPVLFEDFLHSGQREDYYFTEEAIHTVFGHFFELKNMTLIEESEKIFDQEGKEKDYLNKYWAIELINT